MNQKEAFAFFSDGGSGVGSGTAASACIVEDCHTEERYPVAMFLGEATNNEAEIIAGLLGFAALQLFCGGELDGVETRWVADSEYTLKSATAYIANWQRNGWKTSDKKPVKNQGLWRVFLELSRGVKITPEHVRGHTGHTENEACDLAVQFAKGWGESEFGGSEDDPRQEIPGTEMQWLLVDGRDFLEAARADEAPQEAADLLVEKLTALTASSTSPKKQKPKSNLDPDAGKAVVEKLREAYKAARAAAKASPGFQVIADDIEKLAKRIKRQE